jgi:zinc transporter ZupT
MLILFLAVLAGGGIIFLFPNLKDSTFKSILTFGGAYLFSITLIHILPELFETTHHIKTGIFLLLGFFLQLILEYFSGGVEHGHLHSHQPKYLLSNILVIVSLGIHALLEGMLLSHPLHSHGGTSDTLLFAVILHKIPVAFALMSILLHRKTKKRLALILLVIFASSSPLGMFLSDLFYTKEFISEQGIEIIFALVAGSFLHISTTIFFETSPHHKFDIRHWLIMLSGCGLAISLDFI